MSIILGSWDKIIHFQSSHSSFWEINVPFAAPFPVVFLRSIKPHLPGKQYKVTDDNGFHFPLNKYTSYLPHRARCIFQSDPIQFFAFLANLKIRNDKISFWLYFKEFYPVA